MQDEKEFSRKTVADRLSAAAADPSLVDKILERVGEPGGATAVPVEDMALLRLIKTTLDAGGKLQPAVIDKEVDRIHGRLARQTDAILHEKTFQELEATWRGLFYLVENTDFRKGNKIVILDATKDDLVADFEENPDTTRSVYYKQVYSNCLGSFRGTPVGAVVAAYDFGPGQRDINLLKKCANVAAIAHAPFISAAAPSMFGVESFTEIPKLLDIQDGFEGGRFAAWKGFREESDARYVGLTMPRYIARPVWKRDAVKKFTYNEDVSQSHEHYLWANMSFAFAARLTDAYAKYGWCGNIIGPNGGGAVKGMVVEMIVVEGGERIKIPTEVKLPLRREYELAEAGFIPLIWAEDSDMAAFFAAASPKKAKKFRATPEGEAAAVNDFLGTQLPYMFIISRIAHYIKRLQVEQIGASISREMLEKDLNEWIKQYVNEMATSKIAMARWPLKDATIAVTDLAGKPGWYEVDIQVIPHFKYMGAHFTLSLVGKMDNTQKK